MTEKERGLRDSNKALHEANDAAMAEVAYLRLEIKGHMEVRKASSDALHAVERQMRANQSEIRMNDLSYKRIKASSTRDIDRYKDMAVKFQRENNENEGLLRSALSTVDSMKEVIQRVFECDNTDTMNEVKGHLTDVQLTRGHLDDILECVEEIGRDRALALHFAGLPF